MRRMGPNLTSVRTWLTLWNVAVLALVLGILGALLLWAVNVTLRASVDRELADRTLSAVDRWQQRDAAGIPLLRQASPGALSGQAPPGQSIAPGTAAKSKAFLAGRSAKYRPRLFDLQGHPLIIDSDDVPWDAHALTRSAQGQQVYTTIQVDHEPTRVLSVPLRHGDHVVGVMQTVYSLVEVDRDIDALTHILLTLIPLALLAVGGGAAFLADRALRPVREITRAADRIGAEDLSQRLPVVGKDEFSELALTFNRMLGRLQGAFTGMEQAIEQQRRFTADASHELRTPLTIIQGYASLSLSGERTPAQYRQAMQATHRAAGIMNTLVQDLLLLARSDMGQLEIDLRPVSVREILQTSIEMIPQQDHAPIDLNMAEPGLSASGDAHHLVRLFMNLLDNAVRHTPPKGRITLTADGDGEHVTILVEDTGSGISPEHLPHVLERFYRVDAARTRAQGGTGLGLAICRSIVEAHHGSLALASVPGEGTTVTVTLPQAHPPAATLIQSEYEAVPSRR